MGEKGGDFSGGGEIGIRSEEEEEDEKGCGGCNAGAAQHFVCKPQRGKTELKCFLNIIGLQAASG